MKSITFSALWVVLFILVTSSCALADTNPFTGKPTGGIQQDSPIKAPSFLSPVLIKSAELQAKLRSRLVGFAKDIKENPMGSAFWLFLFLSFLYGTVHALGPGHSKVFVVSYFMSRPGSLGSGVLLGVLTMMVHVFSGTILVMGGYFLLKSSGAMTAESAQRTLEIASYSLLTAFGLFFAARIITTGGAHHHHHFPIPGHNHDHDVHSHHDHDHEHAHDHDHHHHAHGNPVSNKSLPVLALFAGMVPCPGSTLLLVYAVSQGLIVSGLLAMAAVSIGMGLTTSGFALAAICSRSMLMRMAEHRHGLVEHMHTALSLLGALTIAGVGGIMLLGQF